MARHKVLLSGFAVILLAAGGILGIINQSKAGTGLTVTPVKVSYTLKAGETTRGSITLTNSSEEAVKVELKVEDFIPVAGAEGIQFVGRAPGVTTVRDWVTLEAPESFVFEKNGTRNIPFVIKAPDNAEPGSHFGVAFFKASKINETGQQLKIGTQVGVLIFITVPGNRLQKGNILAFSTPEKFIQKGPVPFLVKFENTGTVHFEPKGQIKITNIFGKEVGIVPIEGQVVLPTGVKDLSATWNTADLLFGVYKAQISIKDGEGNELTTKSIYIYAFPVWYAIAFFAALAVLFFGIKFLKGRISIQFIKKESSNIKKPDE